MYEFECIFKLAQLYYVFLVILRKLLVKKTLQKKKNRSTNCKVQYKVVPVHALMSYAGLEE
jgi:hypothetical protein